VNTDPPGMLRVGSVPDGAGEMLPTGPASQAFREEFRHREKGEWHVLTTGRLFTLKTGRRLKDSKGCLKKTYGACNWRGTLGLQSLTWQPGHSAL